MTTGNVNIKFLQQPLNNQNFNYLVKENGVQFQTISKTFKAPISGGSSRISRTSLSDLVVDTTFNTGSGFNSSSQAQMCIAEQSDGKIIVGGYFTTYNSVTVNRIVRLNVDGTIDSSFSTGVGFNGGVEDIKIQSDGKILVCGFFTSYNGTTKNRIIRLNTNGTNDTSFSIGSGFNYQADRIAIQSDGKIIVGGQFTTFNGSTGRGLCRLNTNGSIDGTFNAGTGTYDGSMFSYDVFGLAIQTDGKILISGLFPNYNGTAVNGICRVNTNGTIDTGFNSGGAGIAGSNKLGRHLSIQSDGKILLTGKFLTYNGVTVNGICRINTNGTIDSGFNSGGGGLNDNMGIFTSIQSDGKILVAGDFTQYNGVGQSNFVRLNSDGSIEPDNSLSFNAKTVSSLILSTKVYFLGSFSTTTSLATSTSTEIPIGSTMTDTMNNTVSNFNTFNSQSGVTYTISGDTVYHSVDYDNSTIVLTVDNINDIPFFVIITFDDGVDVPIGSIVVVDESNPLSPNNIVNPAYNNTIIRWQTNISNLAYAEVIAGGIGYKIYPFGNSFTFNFKEIAKNLINQNYFKDAIIPDLSVTDIYDDSTLSLELPITINVYDIGNEFLTINRTLKFIKSVEQLPNYANKLANAPAVRTLLPTNNFMDYYIPYFEGYPCDFAVYGITQNDTFYFKNIGNYNQSETYTGTTSEVKRFYLSDGFSDGTIKEDLNLSSNQNKVELWVNDSFVNNLIIDKKESKCGVYLRWFNTSGSYSYWLFDEPYQQSTQYRMIDDIQGVYDNLQSVTSSSEIVGKNGNRTIKLKTKFNKNQREYLESLLASPMVEMYAYNSPFTTPINANSFFGVKVNDGSFPFNTKNSNNTLELTITMPEINTQTL